MASNEQLKITAELDTTSLKKKSNDAANDVSRSLDKIKQKADETSESMESIGSSASSGANDFEKTYTTALDNINSKAKGVKKTLEAMAAIGLAGQVLGGVGRIVGSTSWGKNTASGKATSSALAGAAGGLTSGAVIGGTIGGPPGAAIGAAAGALAGAAGGLIQAAEEQKKAAREMLASNKDKYESISKQNANEIAARNWNRRLQGYANGPTDEATMAKLNNEAANYGDVARKKQEEINAKIKETDEAIKNLKPKEIKQFVPDRSQEGGHMKVVGVQSVEEQANELYEKSAAEIQALMDEQKDAMKKQADLLAIRDGIEQQINAEKEAEAAAAAEAAAQQKREADAKKAEEAKKASDAAKAEESARNSAEKEKRQKGIDKQTDVTNSLMDLMKSQENKFMTLSDSLVRIGGGGGYGAINTSVNQSVSKIVTTLGQLYQNAVQQLNELKRFSNKSIGWTN